MQFFSCLRQMVTPELVTVIMAAIGLMGLLIQKSKCFVRHVGLDTDWGVGFTDVNLVNPPSIETCGSNARARPSPTTSARVQR